jgi:hypothetical protein
VLVTATLIANPDIFATKEIFITGQILTVDPYKMIHFGDYNSQTSITAKTATHSHANRQTNEIGYYIANPAAGTRATLTFRSVDFYNGSRKLYVRAASAAGGTIEVYCDGEHYYNIAVPNNPADTAVAGNAARPGNIQYRTFVAEGIEIPKGDHEIMFALTGGHLRLNWFQFVRANIALDKENMDITITKNPYDGANFAPEVSFISKAAVMPTLIAASYDVSGKLLEINMATAPEAAAADKAADTEITLAASIPVRSNAAYYKVFVWESGTFIPLSHAQTF